MTLDNILEINFALEVANLAGDDNYSVVSKEYADERGVVTKTYPSSKGSARTQLPAMFPSA